LRLYLEPSVLVKLFKREQDSAKMLDVIAAVDTEAQWFACTSAWSTLEVARALKKDGKPKELIELDLKELRRHKISFVDVSRLILKTSENIIASRNIYASDAIHAATFHSISRKKPLDGMLSDDRHFERLRGLIKILRLQEM
jgi:predicted nucleic acid-binding protein